MERGSLAVGVLVVAFAVVSGCNGGTARRDQAVDRSRPDWPVWRTDTRPAPDGPPAQREQGVGPSEKGVSDLAKPDQSKPDQKAVCACKPDQACVDGVCHNKCTAVAPCYADSACGNLQACVQIDATTEVCFKSPTTATGSCDYSEEWCPNHHVCVIPVGAKKGTCTALCTNPGGVCANGRPCFKDSGGCTYCDPYN